MASLIKKYKEKKKINFMEKTIAAQDLTIIKQQDNFNKLQALVREDNFLQLLDITSAYKGNTYNSYSAAVTEIANKYVGTAKWGVAQTGTIIDTRAAFIIGEGLNLSKVSAEGDEGKKELEWAEAFFEYNDIDQEIAQEFAKEAGKEVINLTPISFCMI